MPSAKLKRISHRGGIRGLIKRAKDAQTAVLVGILKRAGKYDRGQHVAQVGKWNAEGTKTIPKRHFLHLLFKKHHHDYRKMMGGLGGNMLRGRYGPDRARRKVGLRATKDLKKIVVEWSKPPNAPSTIRQKGFDDPLVNTGRLRDSIDWREDN